MAWTTPATFSAGAVLTAAQLNAMRDNFNETAPAKATGANGFIVTTGANTVVQRDPGSDTVDTSQTTTSTSFTDLATTGPQVTVTTGTRAIIWFTTQINNTTTSTDTISSFAVSSATTIAASDDVSAALDTVTASQDVTVARAVRYTLTAGSNVFTMKYRVTGGTGQFRRRSMVVMPF